MSRYYEMQVTIRKADPARTQEIQDAASDEWPFEDWNLEDDGRIWANAEGSLVGGESEKEFAERLTKAVWTANGAYCNVEIVATCLENLPCEVYSFDEDDYQRTMQHTTEKPNET
jgi:hypothetical protein